MPRDFTFNDVCDYVKNKEPRFGAIDSVATIVALLTTFAVGTVVGSTAAAPLFAFFGAKNEAVALAKRAYERLLASPSGGLPSRHERMHAAFGLLCYTAFFDALQEAVPVLLSKLKLTAPEKIAISQDAVKRLPPVSPNSEAAPRVRSIDLPHPAEPFEAQKARLLPLYTELAQGFQSFVESLQLWDDASSAERESIRASLQSTPQRAEQLFEAHFIELALRFPEFYMWANLHQHSKAAKQRASESQQIVSYLGALQADLQSLDLGFGRIAEALESIPGADDKRRQNRVLTELMARYEAAISQPVLRDNQQDASGRPPIHYPQRSRIFIPQAFRVLRFDGAQRLEHETTWASLPRRDDLTSFLINFLTSPYSYAAPLVILGQPGSGKSLLTQLLAARFIASQVTPIRVELRDIKARMT